MDTEVASTEEVSSEPSTEVSQPAESTPSAPAESTSPSMELKTPTDAPKVGTGIPVAPAVPSVAVVPPQYQPNTKFKAYGKEHEFEEWAKGLVKDKETEEKFRALHAKAYGLDGAKELHEKYKADVSPKIQEFEKVQRGIQQLSHFVKEKDFDNFFASLNIPEQAVFDWFERKVEEMRQPPHVQQQLQQARLAKKQSYELQRNQELMTQQQQQFVQETQTREIEMFSSLPDYAQIQGAYEQRMGEGAFKKLITDRIQLAQMQGQKLSVAEAMQMVGGTLKNFLGFNQQAPGAPPPNSPMAAAPQAQAPAQREPGKPPVLPNISGKGTSPIKAGFKDLDAMRKAAKAMEKGSQE